MIARTQYPLHLSKNVVCRDGYSAVEKRFEKARDPSCINFGDLMKMKTFERVIKTSEEMKKKPGPDALADVFSQYTVDTGLFEAFNEIIEGQYTASSLQQYAVRASQIAVQKLLIGQAKFASRFLSNQDIIGEVVRDPQPVGSTLQKNVGDRMWMLAGSQIMLFGDEAVLKIIDVDDIESLHGICQEFYLPSLLSSWTSVAMKDNPLTALVRPIFSFTAPTVFNSSGR